MTERRYLIVIKGGEDPAYSAYAPELPGCIATGRDAGGVRAQMRALSLFTSRGSVRAVNPAPSPRA
jgi:hypothetical protein